MCVLLPLYTVHTIWMVLNYLRFSCEKVTLHAAKSKIVSLVSLNGNISKGNCCLGLLIILC